MSGHSPWSTIRRRVAEKLDPDRLELGSIWHFDGFGLALSTQHCLPWVAVGPHMLMAAQSLTVIDHFRANPDWHVESECPR
jgi:hypothetical protein